MTTVANESRAVRLAPSLTGQRLRLRPLIPDDFEFLYQLAIADPVGFRWRYAGSVPPRDRFVHDLWEGVYSQFLVERIDNRERLGLVTSYALDERNHTLHFAVLFRPEVWRSALPVEAIARFLGHLFAVWSLRRAYAEMVSYNYLAVASGEGRLFSREAILRSHAYYNGEYHDVSVISVSPQQWSRGFRRLMLEGG